MVTQLFPVATETVRLSRFEARLLLNRGLGSTLFGCQATFARLRLRRDDYRFIADF